MNARIVGIGALLLSTAACSSPAGAPVTVVASFEGIPLAVAAGSDAAFVATLFGESGRLLRVVEGDDAPVDLVTDAQRPVAIALSDTDVYWAELGAAGASGGSIRRVPRGGGTPETLAKDVTSPLALAVSADRVVWAAADGVYGLELDEGAEPRLLVEAAAPTSVAMDADNVYFAETDAGRVASAPAIGGDAKLVADEQARPRGLAIGKAGLFWSVTAPPLAEGDDESGSATGAIVRSALDDGAAATFAADQRIGGAGRVLLDENAAYWLTTTGADHQVVSSPTPSGAAVSLGTISPSASGGGVVAVVDIALGPAKIYVLTLEGASGQLRALAK